jgi:hypothetical protein
MEKLNFSEIVKIDGKAFTKQFIESLSYSERDAYVEPLFVLFRNAGFLYPDDDSKLKTSYKRLCEYKPDLTTNEVFNNSSLATDICKYFCKSFYLSKGENGSTFESVFNNDELLKRLIRNRLGMDWYYDGPRVKGVNEAFNLSFRMLIQGMRSMMLVAQTSIFKPSIAKYFCERYSDVGDVVADYSCGFGGRMLGAVSCGRKYIGTDPLTVPELKTMASFLGLSGVELIQQGSEYYCGVENSIDLYYSSPPYYNQERYSDDVSQSYNKGEDYFYNVYWKQTLNNVRYMLKSGKVFGLNVKNYPRMVEMAREVFGEEKEIVSLRTVRSHLAHKEKNGNEKFENIYIFRK